jgi:hypothetical protein
MKKLGKQVEVVPRLDPKDTQHIWIIYNNSMSWATPKHYISYQTEQIGTHWFNERYFERLHKSVAVWEYNEVNVKAYEKLNDNISIVSPGIELQPRTHKDIDLLFYGALSDRRKHAVKTIPSMLVVEKILGPRMRELLSRTKVVVNIHYYDTSPLEIFRVNEALSHHCNVISEHSIHGDDLYRDVVKFGTIPELRSFAINSPYIPGQDIKKYCNFEQVKKALELI